MKYFLKRLCVKLKCVYFPTDFHCNFQRDSLKKKLALSSFSVFPDEPCTLRSLQWSPLPSCILGFKLEFLTIQLKVG